LSELVAESPEKYLEISVSLARDRPRLAALRAELRERMERSPLRDSKGFARDVEAVYRQVWRDWCKGQK
jgi:predicted O-linked N-acetylglucosamine transferase (SPINDLY family)